MNLKEEQIILRAKSPSEIFTMSKPSLESEKDAYIALYKPREYNMVKNFVISHKIEELYKKALVELSKDSFYDSESYELKFIDGNNKNYTYFYTNAIDLKLATMYVADRYVIYTVPSKYKKYFDNFIAKTQNFMTVDTKIWNSVKYMVPKLYDIGCKNYKAENGDFVIIINKPSSMYSLREIYEYFDESMCPEHVASILTRLYHFECYLDIVGIQHNGLVLDSLFFSPGRNTKEKESIRPEDLRVVGVYGGWFFSTWENEKISGLPKEVNDILTPNAIKTGYSSFIIDELSIKKIGIKLLGKNFDSSPDALKSFLLSKVIERSAYEEYKNWENVRIESFGARKFVDMNVFDK